MSPTRKPIGVRTLTATLTNPLEAVASLTGVCIHNVGQGDAISIVDESFSRVFHIDYGGKQSSPFKPKTNRVALIDSSMPVDPGRTLMLSHWDEDHWCSARMGAKVLSDAHWLVPRQLTSPRAVERSTKVKTIHCLPERFVGRALKFETSQGDAVWFEKLGRFVSGASTEDCNTTGVAFSITSRDKEVILLPGDAPYHLVKHYWHLREAGYRLRGLLAFHHGADTHWEPETEALLRNWPAARGGQTVVFSYGDPNTYEHPYRDRYKVLLPAAVLENTPQAASGLVSILF